MFKINYSGILADVIGKKSGLTSREIEYFKDYFEELYSQFLKEKKQLGFCKIINNEDVLHNVEKLSTHIKEFQTIVVLGIGGSALGTQAISNVLQEKNHTKKIIVMDNVDPYTIKDISESLDYKSTLFFVISKSGETIETLSQFIFFYEKSKEKQLDPKDHFIFITDPHKGFLRSLSNEEGFTCFDVPEDVGGRFSVLTNVGLLPAFAFGVDISKLIYGAKKIEQNGENAVFLFSIFLYLLNIRKGKSIVVMMPYCDRLTQFAAWFSQLWAESLGKKYGINGEIINTGQTPIIARGVTDQHSQLQLYLEGPKDKVIILIKAKDKINEKISVSFKNYTSINFLEGKSFDDLFEAEYLGTYGALINEGIPVITIEIDKLDMEALGGLFYFFELCTAFSGKLYEINPFDQPGVELGKKIAFGLLGKEGYNAKDYLHNYQEESYEIHCY